jgi:hypothetical protein
VHFGIAEEIGAIPDVIGAGRIIAFVAGRMLFSILGSVSAARGFRRRTSAILCVGRSRSVLTNRPTRGCVARIPGVLRVVAKGVSGH